ncbi:hypothetical protein EAY71_23385 [Vibrio anguillarum]|uniref:hypothetical protein n=1 Tax=Vibrio anguillarum TaxID=55601 RepID=UPI00188A82E9|nr:hypothetical protein [Vibrio anguillarum]MBF4269809.1 hypothetical protein [Vibrio anguillarum]MBF4426007.1 hypothetical protein [Vibrio anguillarum]
MPKPNLSKQQFIEILGKRTDALESQRNEYRSNPSLTAHAKELSENYYRGALNELYRIKCLIEAA